MVPKWKKKIFGVFNKKAEYFFTFFRFWISRKRELLGEKERFREH